jgi:hypothetical protein
VCGINDPRHTCYEYLLLFAKLDMTLGLVFVAPPDRPAVAEEGAQCLVVVRWFATGQSG